ncbi:MAG: hypothetical protein L0271_23040, partial [Gemmatimonadetes bacterium]|nr:hypothetical protein [Gemmatimonadota bacterium]
MSRRSARGQPEFWRMVWFVLRTFGGLQLEADGQPLEAMTGQRRALALLAAIACAGARGLTRDRAMLLLWPDRSMERARGSLKQLLHQIRQQLGDAEVVSGVAELRLNDALIRSDVAQFQQALDAGDDDQAVRLYRGPFLDGVHVSEADEFDHWADQERARLTHLHLEALERLAQRCDAAGQPRAAVAWWRQLQALDPLNARVTLGLMRALDAAGDRAGAVRLAAAYRAAAEEDSVAPDPAVEALADQLREPRALLRLPRRADRAVVAAEAGVTVARRAHVGWIVSGLVVLGLTVSGIVWAGWQRQPAGTGRDRGQESDSEADLVLTRIAVAVFVNRTGSTELDALGTMASDWVTRGLARNPRIDVIDVGGLYVGGREAGGAPADPRTLARRTGAGMVLAGNYYRSGDSLTFSAQVMDVASGRVLRAIDPISGSTAEPLAVIEEVRQRATTALGTILDPRGSIYATPAMVPPRLDAFEAFVRGQELYWLGDWVASLPHFRTAARLDSSFALALAFLSVVGVGTAQCGLADSVLAVLEARANVPEMEQLTARVSVARCASDHAEHNR